MALLVSGGHSSLLLVPDVTADLRPMGRTIDDAAGEAFDKVARVLGLPFPGGPYIDRAAVGGDRRYVEFPRGLTSRRDLERHRYDFSFSGLKTAVLRAVQSSDNLERDRADLARAFQDAVLTVLVEKAYAAMSNLGYSTLVIGGGVACNRALAAAAAARVDSGARVIVASNRLNTDNAAMIGAAAAFRLARGEHSGGDLEPRADLPFPGLASTSVPAGTPR